MNEIAQWAAVAVIVVIAVVAIIRRVVRHRCDGGSSGDCGCGSCSLKDNCNKPSKK